MLYVTEIRARCPHPDCRKLHTYQGPNVPGISLETAQEYCEENSLGYCKVVGVLIAETDLEGNIIEDYETPRLN